VERPAQRIELQTPFDNRHSTIGTRKGNRQGNRHSPIGTRQSTIGNRHWGTELQIILDNLLAVIVTAGILLVLVAVNHRSKMAAAEITSFYSLREQQLNFVDILKRDMQNMTEVKSLKEDASTRQFKFMARTEPGDPTIREVMYKRVAMSSIGGVNTFQIQRIVTGQPAGGSAATITGWKIEARNAEGMQVAAFADARQIFIQFEAINPFNQGNTVDRARWEATFRPPQIQQKENI
jgi:hypothetical protein